MSNADLHKRVKTPTILQMENAECGVVCLAMVLAHYGRWVSTETLRMQAGVSRDGSSAAGILKTARSHGLEAAGYTQKDLAFTDIRFPCIIHWNFNHFVTLEGIRGDVFYINDPAAGRRRVNRQEFSRSFTGVVLNCVPGETFEKKGERPNWYNSLKSYLGEVSSLLRLVFWLGVLMVVPGMMMPVFSRIFIDDILIHRYDSWLWPLLIGLLSVGLLQALIRYIQGGLMLTLQTRFATAHGSRFIQQVFQLPLQFFAQRSPAEMAARPQLIDRLGSLISGPLGMAAIGLVTAVSYLVVMFFYDVYLSAGILLIAAVNAALFIWQSNQFRSLNQVIVRERSRFAGATAQSLQLLPEIKASGAETMLFTQLLGQKAKLQNQMQKLTVRKAFISALPPFMQTVSVALLMLLGGQRVMAGDMTIGVFVAFQGLMVQFMGPLQQILSLFNEMQETQGNLDRLEDVTRHEEQVDIDWSLAPDIRQSLTPHLSLESISFGYQPLEPPMLDNFSLDIAPGTWVALVGASGSGKSTLAKLVAGLHKPWSGKISLGGKEIQDIPSTLYRSTISVVDQNIVLFNASISDNISLWNSCIDEDRIIAAAKAAEIHDWAIHRPGGYTHKIAENGGNLSGGEKARIEIARALAVNPGFIILDEATAALDPLVERQVLDNVQEACQCGIIISHRISAIRNCDTIIVFDQGRPVQQGSHDELINQGGLYRQLYNEETS